MRAMFCAVLHVAIAFVEVLLCEFLGFLCQGGQRRISLLVTPIHIERLQFIHDEF